MASTLLQDVLDLARQTQALSQDQRDRILSLAPQMNDDRLAELKQSLLKVQASEMAHMEKKVAVYEQAALAHTEWKSSQAHAQLSQAESTDRAAEAAHMENLLTF